MLTTWCGDEKKNGVSEDYVLLQETEKLERFWK